MPDFVTLRAFDFLPDAQIALGRLEAEGIDAWLLDAHFVQMDWLYAIALGGIKLQVHSTQADAAREVLATDYSSALAHL